MSNRSLSSRGFSFIIVVLIVIGYAGCAKQGNNREEMVAANRELDQKLSKAFLAKDLDGIMSCWWNNPDAVNIPADNIEAQRGYEVIKRAVKFQLDGIENVVKFEFVEQHYEVYGDAVVGSGKTLFTLRPKGAPNDVGLSIRYTDVRQMKNRKWVYVYSHESMQSLGASTAGK